MPSFAALAAALHRVLSDCDLAGFGVASFDNLVRVMKSVGVEPPPHWKKGIK